MTNDQAIEFATSARAQFAVPAEYAVRSADLRIIEIVATEPVRDELPGPGPVIDRVAWLVRFGLDMVWAELAVDDQSGRIIRFRRSRGAAASWNEERA